MSETVSDTPVLINPSDLKSEPLDRPPSPETNCPICLDEFTNKSYTNSCLHQFCYNCLKEWSRIKAECPLCKQRFHTIIYNVRSLEDFDEYHVNTSSIEHDQTVFINFTFPASPYSLRNPLDLRRNPLELRQRMVSTSSMLYFAEMNGLVNTPETLHPATLPLEHEFRTANFRLSRYRRDIYRRGHWVRPSQSSRTRQSSPEFYRLNPAQTHRLVPWLTMELNVLLDVSIDSQNLVQEILNLITVYPIQSRHFREAMRPYLGERTEHFVHEFYHFAISPHDIVWYDTMAEYAPHDNRPHRLAREESSESDSDVEVVNILRGNISSGTNSLDLTSNPGPSTNPMRFTETVIEISDSSNSDDEVEIVGMISPVTPETIIIESTDEDMDVPESGSSSSFHKVSSEKNNDSTSRLNPSSFKDTHPQNSSSSEISLRHKGNLTNPTKEIISSSPSSSSSSSSPSSLSPSTPLTSQTSSSTSSFACSSSLSTVSDSDYNRRKSSHKRKRRKSHRRERVVKRHRRRMRVESSSSDDDYSFKKIVKRRLKSVVVKSEEKSVLTETSSDSD